MTTSSDATPPGSAPSGPPGSPAPAGSPDLPDDTDDSADAPDPRRWKALAVCLVGGFMVLLDVSIVNVALKSINQGLHTSGDQIQWVLSGYALTFGLLLVPAGRLGDVRGRRGVFIGGLLAFTAASVLCGAAQSATWLVIARLVQGLAGGVLTPQISGLIQQLFTGRERGRAFGLFGSMVGISTALGPVIGGLLIQAFGEADGWRWVFFVNLPIGLITVPFALRLLPSPGRQQQQHRHDFDPIGVLLLGVAVVVLLLPLVQEQQWKGSAKWLLLPLAAILLAAFVAWEFRYRASGRESLVDLRLFNLRSFSFGSSMITLYFAGFTPLFFVVTLLLQFGLGYSALAAGLTTLPFALGAGLAAAASGRVVFRFGRPLVLAGLALSAIGYVGVIVAVHRAPVHHTALVLLLPLLVAGVGSGLVVAPNQTLTLSQVPVEQGGTAGGLLQVGQRVGSAVGIAAVGSVFYARLAASHGQFAQALERGLVVAVGFLVLAFVLTAVDVLLDRRSTARAEQGESRPA